MGDLRRSQVRWWRRVGSQSGVPREAARWGGRWSPSWGRCLRADLGLQGGGAPPPGGFLGLGRGWDAEAGPSRRRKGATRVAGPGGPPLRGPRLGGGGWWPPAARLAAALLPGGRCILGVSTRGCGRKEGIRPLHTSPLVRHAPSLAPARSLAHTHARTRRRGFPSRARSPSGSAGLRTRPPAGAQAPAARSARGDRTGGGPGRSPR